MCDVLCWCVFILSDGRALSAAEIAKLDTQVLRERVAELTALNERLSQQAGAASQVVEDVEAAKTSAERALHVQLMRVAELEAQQAQTQEALQVIVLVDCFVKVLFAVVDLSIHSRVCVYVVVAARAVAAARGSL